MADTMTLPGVGDVKRTQVIAVGGVAAGILAYAWWRSRSGTDEAETLPAPEPEDPFEGSFGSGGGSGAVSGYPDSSSDTRSNAPRTNAEWSQLAAEKLADSYEPSVINGALGRYLGRQPLTQLDQVVVRAAIARAGYPPEGSYTVIPGGEAKPTVAPARLRQWKASTTTAVYLEWDPVPGAVAYRIFRPEFGGEPIGDSQDTKFAVHGLQPNRSYRFTVAARAANGTPGPHSNVVTLKTSVVKLSAPTGVKVSNVTRSSARVSWNKVSGAESYRVYVNGQLRASADGGLSSTTVTGLSPRTRYTVDVRGDTSNQEPGPMSAKVSFTTSK